jgi:hypothetical protein
MKCEYGMISVGRLERILHIFFMEIKKFFTHSGILSSTMLDNKVFRLLLGNFK